MKKEIELGSWLDQMCGQVDRVDGSEGRWMSGQVDKTVVATCIPMSYVNTETSNRFV